MNKWKRYVFTEANRQYRLTNKAFPLSHFIKRSWGIAKLLETRNITPYCGFN